jgi:hypothetical protein
MKMTNAYRDNAKPYEVPWTKPWWADSIRRTVFPGALVGVVGLLAAFVVFVRATCASAELSDRRDALDSLKQERDRHYAEWESALQKRQAIVDEKEKEESARELLRRLSTEELKRREAEGK